MPKKYTIVVIGGGTSSERAISLMTAAKVAEALPRSKYSVSAAQIEPDGQWKRIASGKQATSRKSGKALVAFKPEASKIDAAFIALHGKNGEDGKIQAMLELAGIPYTGSGVLASALAMNKVRTMEFVARYGIRVPAYLPLYKKEKTDLGLLDTMIRKQISYPCVVKPNEAGSSVGIRMVKNKAELKKAVAAAFKEDDCIIVQRRIRGRELTCAVMGNTHETDLVTLPPIEIVPKGRDFFDYKAKYFSEATEEICPAPISKQLAAELADISKQVHFLLGCDGLTRSDFILAPDGKSLYFLEINTIPGLTEASLCPKAAKVAGMSFSRFLDKQVDLALKKHRK